MLSPEVHEIHPFFTSPKSPLDMYKSGPGLYTAGAHVVSGQEGEISS